MPDAIASVIRGTAAWLLTYALHSTLLLAAAWAAVRILRPSAALQDALWKAALVGALVTASWQSLGPGAGILGGRVEIAGPAAARVEIVTRPGPSGTVLDGATGRPLDAAPGTGGAFLSPRTLRVDGGRAMVADREPPPGAWTRARAALGALAGRLPAVWPVAFVLLWLAGAAARLTRLVSTKRRLHRLLSDRAGLPAGAPHALLSGLRRAAGRRKPVRLTVSDRIAGPVALGRDEICLPRRALTDLTPAQLESALAHELGHLMRRDPAWLLAGAALEAAFFFQPLNRVARRRLRETAEFLCDDWAVRHTGGSLTLARCLAEVAGWVQHRRRPALASAMAESGSPLVRRIERLLDPSPRRREPGRFWSLAAAGALVAGVAVSAPGVTAGRAQHRPPETFEYVRIALDDAAPGAVPADTPLPALAALAGPDDSAVKIGRIPGPPPPPGAPAPRAESRPRIVFVNPAATRPALFLRLPAGSPRSAPAPVAPCLPGAVAPAALAPEARPGGVSPFISGRDRIEAMRAALAAFGASGEGDEKMESAVDALLQDLRSRDVVITPEAQARIEAWGLAAGGDLGPRLRAMSEELQRRIEAHRLAVERSVQDRQVRERLTRERSVQDRQVRERREALRRVLRADAT